MAFNSSTLQQPRERFLHPAVSLLDTSPEVNFQCGRFEARLNILTFHFWKIEIFCKFVKNNVDKVIEKGLVYGDVHVFLSLFRKCFLEQGPN